MTYILLHKSAGWLTTSGVWHSDYRQAAKFDADEAADMIRVHSGKLVPVPLDFYTESLKGVKL